MTNRPVGVLISREWVVRVNIERVCRTVTPSSTTVGAVGIERESVCVVSITIDKVFCLTVIYSVTRRSVGSVDTVRPPLLSLPQITEMFEAGQGHAAPFPRWGDVR